NALQNPLSIQHLSDEELPAVHGLFTGSSNGKQISLQVFDRRRLLSTSGLSLILHRGTFRKLTDGGLTLDTKLAAAVEENRLYFHSFALARRLFDLSEYFREATDGDLATFVEHKAVLFDDPDSLMKNADSWVRKKVALILQSGILEKERPAKIATTAQKFGLAIEVQTVARRDKLRFPSEKKRLKELLHFLDEDYLTSILTGTNYLSNSKRRLSRSAAKVLTASAS
ncbi:MAG TPA: Kiwa anti-phage protein KwaB-like domain-containing protein, partial [Candidatus Eisenbacteria bacterium]|nr:Kiwa anti-phage protein KwaB-like domain-containing protein [Candidatus Eisenbacteria bacterium]